VTLVTVEALQQAGFLVSEAATSPERSERPERPERADVSRDMAELNVALDRHERTVERLERSLDTAIDRMDERAERSVERALERVVERLLDRRAREAMPAVPVRPLTSQPRKPIASKAEVLQRIRELKAESFSLQHIADRLNADGVPTISGRGKWQKGTIGHLLAQAGEA